MKRLLFSLSLLLLLIVLPVQATTLPTLDVTKETKHFKIYCSQPDASCLDDIANRLEEKYQKISSDLAYSFKTKIQIKIYPDLISYHTAVGFPDAPDWMVGNADKSGGIKMVSPLNPGPSHDYQSILKVVVHEATHIFVFKINPKVPLWLNEGVALFEAEQMDANRSQYLIAKLKNNQIPKFEDLETDSIRFAEAGGYQWSYTIIEYAVNSFGTPKLLQWIKNGGAFERTFGISKEEFRTKWIAYLKTVYNEQSINIEIKATKVHNVYWEGDSRIQDLKASKPHSLLLEVEFSPLQNISSPDQISNFFAKAGSEFILVVEGKPPVTARIYEGNIYKTNSRTFWGFWAVIQETDYNKLESGVTYNLVPKELNAEYKWLIDENVTIMK